MNDIKPIELQMWAVVNKKGEYAGIDTHLFEDKPNAIDVWFFKIQGYRCIKVNVKVEPIL